MTKFSAMAKLRRTFSILLVLALGAGTMFAASGEVRAYSGAAQAFHDQIWWLAESSFGQFIDRFPRSEQRPQAVLYQAIARFHQTNSIGAIDLLRANLERAGALADEYQFWIAEGCFQNADFGSAAAAYGELWRRYAASKRRLEAFVGEAACRSRLVDWTGVVALLARPDGEFARTAPANLTNGFIARGYLLLGEAQLALKNYAGAEQSVAPLRGQQLAADLGWRAERLNYEARFVTGRFPEALITSSNLVSLAAGQAELLSESRSMQAAVLERLGRPEQASAAYELNLAPGTRGDRQRQALLKLTQLALTQGNIPEATNRLVKFLNLSSNEPAADVALLELGEIHLQVHAAAALTNRSAAAAGRVANDLDIALGLFDRLAATFTNSGLVGKAELDRGWCFWLKPNQLAESANAFERAVQHPLEREDRIVAQFKLGDARFAQTNFAEALKSYQQAAEALSKCPEVEAVLGGQLYFQILQTSQRVTNIASATEAMKQILKLQPGSEVADRSLLLMGQGLADWGDPTNALAQFKEFVAHSPDSPLRPEVELVLGRMREQQNDWPGVIAGYEQWLERFPTNALRPRAEFQLAWANWQALRETNAYSAFTNFVALYPTNELAPQAQWWVADYFWRQRKYTEAEINYKVLFTTWKDSELADQARLKAGQAALEEVRYDEACNHFTNLTSDVKLIERAPQLWLQAVFAYGNTLMAWPSSDKTKPLANYEEAIRVFGKIHQQQPSNAVAVLAWGEVAKCWRQMGAAYSSNAIAAFSQVITSSVVNIAARSEAQVGLAGVYADVAQQAAGEEQQNLLRLAVRHLSAIVYRENVNGDAEVSDAFWVKRAGLDAGPLLEKLGDWKAAELLYARLQSLLPSQRATFQPKIEQLRERQKAAEKNQPRI